MLAVESVAFADLSSCLSGGVALDGGALTMGLVVAGAGGRVEVVPAIPFPGALWIGGYWGWSSGRHVWVPGRWEHPRPGYQWRPHAWVQQGGRWHLQAGGWIRM